MQRNVIKVDFSTPTIELIANKLEQVKWNSNGGFNALCPAHHDINPSLSVSEGDNGRILYCCHAGCSYQDIITAMDTSDDFPPEPNNARAKKPITSFTRLEFVRGKNNLPDFKKLCGKKPRKVYKYCDSQKRLYGFVARFKDKRFVPVTPWENEDGDLVWRTKGFADNRPLYGLERLEKSDHKKVLIVEGEKTADAAKKLFPMHNIVTWQGGSNAVEKSNWAPLAGHNVSIWPDADEPGLKAAKAILKVLRKIGTEAAKQVELPESLPKGWDLADLAPKGVNIDALLDDAKPVGCDLTEFLLSTKQLAKKKVKKREMIINPFLPTQSINLTYATRGVGKTWFGITMAKNIALGKSFLGYEVPKPRRVLFIDGEMPLADLQARFKVIGTEKIENIDILASEIIYEESHPLNINKAEDRDQLSAMLKKLKIQNRAPELIILDNLSSLRVGADENDNSALDYILVWLRVNRP